MLGHVNVLNVNGLFVMDGRKDEGAVKVYSFIPPGLLVAHAGP